MSERCQETKDIRDRKGAAWVLNTWRRVWPVDVSGRFKRVGGVGWADFGHRGYYLQDVLRHADHSVVQVSSEDYHRDRLADSRTSLQRSLWINHDAKKWDTP